jgi:hypothetical protein
MKARLRQGFSAPAFANNHLTLDKFKMPRWPAEPKLALASEG